MEFQNEKGERVKRRLHMFWHKLIPPFCIEYNGNWKTKFENRAEVSVMCTKTRLTDTRKRKIAQKNGVSMERDTVEAIIIYSPPRTRRAFL